MGRKISTFSGSRAISTPPLKKLTKDAMHPLQLCLNLPQYILYTDTNTVNIVESPIISKQKKDNFHYSEGIKKITQTLL